MAGNNTQIAVIGLGFKGPMADNLEDLWKVLEEGINCISEIPKERFNIEAFYDPDPQVAGKCYTRKAGLLSKPYDFDNAFFNMNDMESDQTDPQQKWVLECTYKAMEHAGVTRDMLKGSNTAVYVGAMNCDFRGLFPVRSSNISNYSVTGVANSIIAARVSFIFDLRGPCMVIDTGCSSALIAIHQASKSLLLGECNMAICGGVNFIATPDLFVHLTKAQMASPTGQSHAFSEKADGYTRGEGCGMVILKRLCDAVRDNNRILGIIKTSTNQDGHEVSPISAPSKVQQMMLLEDVYKDFSEQQLDEIEYIEAHGTGTQVGDVAEANALGKFFLKKNSTKNRRIGSIKTNIGHLESASGAAGLIKVLLMMEHNKIVPSLFSDHLNTKINFHKLQLTVANKTEDWVSHQKVAGVNSFGFGGSNCHAIVKSYAAPEDEGKRSGLCEKKPCIVCFSGKNETSLKGSITDFLGYENIASLDVHDISYTSTVRRDHYKYRQAFVVHSIKELRESLSSIRGQVPAMSKINEVSVVFVFGGMGTTWEGMCKEFLVESEIFCHAVEEIDACLKSYVNWSLTDRLRYASDFKDVLFSPIAIFACQVALAKLLLNLGVKPAYIVGQSVGEVSAAYVAGFLSLQDAVKIIYKRSYLLAKVESGKMFIVRNMDISLVKDVVYQYNGKVNVSLEYSPVSCAISCSKELAETIKNDLRNKAQTQDLTFKDLDVPTAYHSHFVDSVKAELRQELNSINPRDSSTYQMISTVSGQLVKGPLGPAYWVDNLRETVRFHEAIRNTHKPNALNAYVEISPIPVLTSHLPDIYNGVDNVISVASMKPKVEWETFLKSLASLYCNRVNISWDSLPHYGNKVTPIPRYSFQTRAGYCRTEAAHLNLSGVNYMRLQHPFVYSISNTEMSVMLSQLTFPSVYEHKISNMLIVPGAFYPEIGFAVTKFDTRMKALMYAVSAQFEQPFKLPQEGTTVFEVESQRIVSRDFEPDNQADYRVFIKHEGTIYATLELKPINYLPAPAFENIQFVKGKCAQEIEKEEIYGLLRQYGFDYGPNYSLLQSGQKCQDLCLAKIKVPDSLCKEIPGTTLHPSVIDGMIQASIILINDQEKPEEIFPRAVGSLVCYKEIEKEMYIVVTRKGTEGDLTYYDVHLTTLSGQSIAYMKNLTHKQLSGRNKHSSSIYNCIWTKVDRVYRATDSDDQRVLFITDFLPEGTTAHLQNHCLTYDIMNKPWEVIETNADKIKGTNDVIAIIAANININDYDTGDVILEKTENLCLFIKAIYASGYNNRIQKPFFVFTRNAFSLDIEPGSHHQTNPIMTSCYGMFRCGLRESVYENCIFVDLNVQQESITLPFIASITKLINSNEDLKKYPEYLITDKHLYKNQIARCNQETPIPNLRLNHADNATNFLILSSNPSDLEKTFAVNNERSIYKNTSDKVRMALLEAAIPSSCLYKLDITISERESWQYCEEDGFLLMAVEGRGLLIDVETQKTEVCFCYPVAISSQIEIPKELIIKKEILYNYKPGDITKMLVLMELCSKVDQSANTKVSILASKSTLNLAKCLDVILQSLNPSRKIDVVMIEELNEASKIGEVLISLEYIEKKIIATMENMETKPDHIITVNKLVEHTLTFFCFVCPTVNIIATNTNELLCLNALRSKIPTLVEWITSHQTQADAVCQYLHEQNTKYQKTQDETVDLRKILEFEGLPQMDGFLRVKQKDFFRKNSVYLVVGGLTGLGWLTVKYLAENGAGCIAILNRRQASSQQQENIAQLSQDRGCEIEVFNGDVCEYNILKQVFTLMESRFPRTSLRGVFLSAAVLEDKPLLDMTREDFHKVLLPKVKGAWNLHLLTMHKNVDYFVLYSSISSVFGNINQANYGAGNAFMDGLAYYRRSKQLSGQSINWGALDIGMLEGNEHVRKILEAKGFVIMSETEIIDLLSTVLLINDQQIMPCRLNEQIIFERRHLDTPLHLQSRLEPLFKWGTTQGITVQNDILAQINSPNLRDKVREQRLQLFEAYLCNLASQVLDITDGTLDAKSNLSDFGLDSVVAMTMKTNIFKQTGCKLHPVILLNGQAIIHEIALDMDEKILTVTQTPN